MLRLQILNTKDITITANGIPVAIADLAGVSLWALCIPKKRIIENQICIIKPIILEARI